MIPPATKKTRLVRMYMIPIRLWSTVASQPEKRPRETIVAAGSGATLRATATTGEALDIGEQSVHLLVAPATPHGGHLVAAVQEQRLDRGRLLEDRVAAQVRPERSLCMEPVAGRAGAVERHLPEVRGAVRLRAGLVAVPGLEVAVRDRLYGGDHVRVLVAAELTALSLERPRAVGAEPEVVRLAGDRVQLALERR